MLSMRMTRHGAKKRPYYHIIVADARSPRDGKFIERIGSYNPMLPKDHAQRVQLDAVRVQHWLSVGAQPSERIARFLHAANLGPKPVIRPATKKSLPKAKAQERLKQAAAAVEAAKKAAEAPAAEAPAEEAQA